MAFNALLLFTFIYYTRPEDFIPGLHLIPLEKILGGVALVALISTLSSGSTRSKLPLELKLLLVLFVHLTLTIPFSYWPGGSFATVFFKYSKTVIIAFLVTLVVDSFEDLRKLLWVQAASMVALTLLSILIHHTDNGRLIGAFGGTFENPNDLAIHLSINWPLCLGFLLAARGMGRKVPWAIGLMAMLVAVVLTYSRSGLLSMVMAVGVSLWEFGIKGKRRNLLVGAAIFAGFALAVFVVTPGYLARVESIFRGNVEGSRDKGSLEARKQLLLDSAVLTIHHPLFGIGPGNFGAATGTWKVTHNSYMEFASEGGLPALFLFLAVLYLSMRNLKRIRQLPIYLESEELRIMTGALWAGLSAFSVGALFASFEYHLFPYFMVAYTSVLYRVASRMSSTPTEPTPRKSTIQGSFWRRYSGEPSYGRTAIASLDRTR
jgi:O-antigen ligase